MTNKNNIIFLKGEHMEFEILKTGKFLSSNGQEKEFSQTDLENIASSYDPSVSEAPLVIGHPKTNDPAYGWIENLKVIGDRLIAKAKQVVPEFLEAVKNGLFKKRSVSLTQDGKLRHVGFLGAELPAVKGLADLSFSENETDTTYEFSDIPSNSSVISTTEGRRNPIIQPDHLYSPDFCLMTSVFRLLALNLRFKIHD